MKYLFFRANENFEFAQMKFFSHKCNMPITIMENRIWVYLSVGFGKLNLVKDSKFWGVKMHWIINRWKWQIALEIFLTEWEILILVHNDSIY